MSDRVPDYDPKKYRLTRAARANRWWRARREAIGLSIVAMIAVAAGAALWMGNVGLAAGLGVVGLLYLIYAYTNWFNDMH